MSAELAAQLDAISTPLPWQRDAWERLRAAAEQDRLPHALLISGETGSGRRRFATALSRFLLCQAPRHGSNCGECKTCLLSRSQGHSDWRWLEPAGKSRSIGVEQIREVIRFTMQTSALGKYKILVLHPADGLTLAAANAFLKCLEEPAPNTLIILIARASSGVPATLRSRCQRLPLPAPDASVALDWLSLVCGDEAWARRALTGANGMPLTAEHLLRDDDALQAAEALQKALSGLLQGRADPVQAIGVLGDLDAGTVVQALRQQLYCRLRELSAANLREPGARALLLLDTRLQTLQRAIAGGATPQRDLLVSTLVAQLHGILGGAARE